MEVAVEWHSSTSRGLFGIWWLTLGIVICCFCLPRKKKIICVRGGKDVTDWLVERTLLLAENAESQLKGENVCHRLC